MESKFKTTWFWASLAKLKYAPLNIPGTGRWQSDENQQQIDFADYAQRLQVAYEQLDAEGYEVVNVVPVAMGTVDGEVCYSITRGAVVVGKRRDG